MQFVRSEVYKGPFDAFCKISQQEGFFRLWRGTNASLLLAVPTVGIYMPCYDVFRDWLEDFSRKNAPEFTPYAPSVAGAMARALACITCSPIELAKTRMQAQKFLHAGMTPPGMWETLVGVLLSVKNKSTGKDFQGFQVLWTGAGTQLARDVPFSAICWVTLEPLRRHLLGLVESEANALSILGANFSAGIIAGGVAAAVTCPLDVAKTRRQTEKDPIKAIKTSTRKTLVEIWRDGGVRGLFTGVVPRVIRAGPSVGIVVSFYELVKYMLHQADAS
ncbi:mitochondrial carrier protein MTM1 isoform X2 [Cryptomeria japonica]|nr:mitochondrial carrier protein MTM1 isoform X2 [Cryptomeria japonica]